MVFGLALSRPSAALCRLNSHEAAGVRAVLLAPARELALQTYKVVTEIAKHTDLRSAVLVGGDSMAVQFAELSASPDIIVATPGRLLHHLSEIPGFNLKNTRHIVLDEADRLFEMGLGSQVRLRHLVALVPSRQLCGQPEWARFCPNFTVFPQ